MRLVLELLLLFLLAACGGAAQTSPTTAPTTNATPVPATAATAGNPTIQVTGDVSATVVANNFYIAPVKADDSTTIGTMLYLNQDDQRVLFIRFPWNAQPGAYQITQGFSDNYDGTTATGNYIDQTSGTMMQFAATGGTLTLDTTGNSYSGSYEFTAQDESGKSITISGTFSAIPFEPPAS